jgi:phosphoglycerate dehydrogenase-like enzyme
MGVVQELSIGVLGLGEIGRTIATTCGQMGMRVSGLVRTIPDEASQLPGVTYYTMDELPKLLAASDYVCNVLPSTPATRGLLGGGALARCKPDACLINVGRGDVIAETELVDALQKGLLAGAVLDVFEKEPLPITSKLWGLPDVVITPHEAALSFPHQVAEAFAENLDRYLADPDSLCFQVDLTSGY